MTKAGAPSLRARRAPLENGTRVAVIGGGPAGSLFAYYLLSFARRVALRLEVDIFEPRDFTVVGPTGCNMCGGIISESLVQALAVEGIDLPPSLVQRGIDAYELHTTDARLAIETPLKEKRIAAVHRGGGPRDAAALRWGGLDGYLLGLARELGAKVVPARVTDVGRSDRGWPEVRLGRERRCYGLLVGASGVKTGDWSLYDKLGLASRPPRTVKTFVTELNLGWRRVSRRFGSAMHVFLLGIPRVDCAAMIPKGDHVTVCLLGEGIDSATIDAFFRSEPVRRCLPARARPEPGKCRCAPRVNVREATRPFADRVVLVGDCGVSRLYKDGIGAAYRTAKAAARTAVFSGVAAADFERHYAPHYRSIARDNRYGALLFRVMRVLKAVPPLLRGVMSMAAREQAQLASVGPMSLVLWDMFTGSAPYREIFWRTLHPRFVGRFLWESARAAVSRRLRPADGAAASPLVSVGGASGERQAAGLSEAEIEEGLLGRAYADGELVCRQGERGDRMFVIRQGRAEVVCQEGGREVVVGELGPGEVFGETTVEDGQARSASVRAKGPARVLTLDQRAFLRRVQEDPSLAYRTLEGMSLTMRRLTQELALLRNVTRIALVKHVYVVPRERAPLYAALKAAFAGDPEIEVVVDRRQGERRQAGAPCSIERRSSERRNDQPWSVRLSQPYRRGRGRSEPS